MADHDKVGRVPDFPRRRDGEALLDEGQPGLPATYTLIALFVFVLGGEYLHSFTYFPADEAPSLRSLLLLGAGSRPFVFDLGQYFRLLTLGFLHGSLMHFMMNALCLVALGRQLEPRIGGAWFFALFFLGTIGASLISMLWNGPEVVAVGASGGIMALAAFLGIAALRMPPGIERRTALSLVRGLIIATMLVGFLAGLLLRIDNAAHVGGLLAGSVLGVVIIPLWRDLEYRPGGAWLATAIAVAGFVLLLYGATVMSRVQ